eukprot:gene3447-2398_t
MSKPQHIPNTTTSIKSNGSKSTDTNYWSFRNKTTTQPVFKAIHAKRTNNQHQHRKSQLTYTQTHNVLVYAGSSKIIGTTTQTTESGSTCHYESNIKNESNTVTTINNALDSANRTTITCHIKQSITIANSL